MTLIVSPDTEAFFREGLSEEKDGPVRGGGVQGPDAVEDLSRSGDLTGKGIDDGLELALFSRQCSGGFADGGGDGGMFKGKRES